MPKKNRISIEWGRTRPDDLEDSLEALYSYNPAPAIAMSVALEGDIPRELLTRIIDMCENWDVAVGIKIQGTFDKNRPPKEQVRLFGPGPLADEPQPLSAEDDERARRLLGQQED